MSVPPSSPRIFSSSSLLIDLSIVHRVPCFTYLDVKIRENSHLFGRSFQNFLVLPNRPIVSPALPHSFKFRPAPCAPPPIQAPWLPQSAYSRFFPHVCYNGLSFFGRTLTHEKMSLSVPVSSARPRPCAVRTPRGALYGDGFTLYRPDADG